MSVHNKTGQMKGLFPTDELNFALNQICGPNVLQNTDLLVSVPNG